MFAMEHYGVPADLYTLAKSIAGGFPPRWSGAPTSWTPAAPAVSAERMPATPSLAQPHWPCFRYSRKSGSSSARNGSGNVSARHSMRSRRAQRDRGCAPARRDDRLRAWRGAVRTPGRGTDEKADDPARELGPILLSCGIPATSSASSCRSRPRTRSWTKASILRRRRRSCSPTPTQPCRACASPAEGPALRPPSWRRCR